MPRHLRVPGKPRNHRGEHHCELLSPTCPAPGEAATRRHAAVPAINATPTCSLAPVTSAALSTPSKCPPLRSCMRNGPEKSYEDLKDAIEVSCGCGDGSYVVITDVGQGQCSRGPCNWRSQAVGSRERWTPGRRPVCIARLVGCHWCMAPILGAICFRGRRG